MPNALDIRRLDITTRYELSGPDGIIVVELVKTPGGFRASVGDRIYDLRIRKAHTTGDLVVEVSNKPTYVTLWEADGQSVHMSIKRERLFFKRLGSAPVSLLKPPAVSPPKEALVAPMPGKVISLMARKGDDVEVGDPLVVIESMKMETAIRSDRKGAIEAVLVVEGSTVKRGQVLLKFRV